MEDLRFDESLVAFIDDPASPEEVERRLARVLSEKGLVGSGFADAVVEREAEYPTALEVGEHNVAIPHCDACHTVSPAVCVGVLERPVPWHRMDDADETCDVELVIMLALSDPHGHLDILQRVIGLVQDQGLVQTVLGSNSAADVVSLIGPRLLSAPAEGC